jgi:hypothetical protein
MAPHLDRLAPILAMSTAAALCSCTISTVPEEAPGATDSRTDPIGAGWADLVDVGAHDDSGRGVAMDKWGRVAACGTVMTAGAESNLWLRRYSSNGNPGWTKQFPGGAEAVALSSEGHALVAGWMPLASTALKRQLFVRRYDTGGAQQWHATVNTYWTSVAGQAMVDVAVDSGSSTVWAANIADPAPGHIAIGKLDAGGQAVWTKSIWPPAGGSPWYAAAVAVNANNEIALAGRAGDFGGGFVKKLDAAGVEKWHFDVPGTAALTDVVFDWAGDIALTARAKAGQPPSTIGMLATLAADGSALKWQKLAGADEQFNSVAIGAHEIYWVTGSRLNPLSSFDMLVRAYSPAKLPLYTFVLNGSEAGSRDSGRRIAAHWTLGTAVAVGTIENDVTGDDLVVRHFTP